MIDYRMSVPRAAAPNDGTITPMRIVVIVVRKTRRNAKVS